LTGFRNKGNASRLKNVLDTAVKVLNYIKACPLQSRLLHIICLEMGTTQLQLLLHTEGGWLSRGKVFTRLFELQEEVRIFLTDHPFQHCASFGYFSRLNELNRGLQRNVTFYDLHDKIAELYPAIGFLSFPEPALGDVAKSDLEEHSIGLQQLFCTYFPTTLNNNNWARNTFAVDTVALPQRERERMLELSWDGTLADDFKKRPVSKFWIQAHKVYPQLSDKAIRLLITFATTYLCEAGFLTLTAIKRKYSNTLDVEADQNRLEHFSPLCKETGKPITLNYI
jgi:zinc finger BED domain-containing protein 5/7/8/9